jgi:transposase
MDVSALPTCPGCLERDRRIASLEAEVGRLREENLLLRRRIDELVQQVERLSRQAKRQAAPFSRNDPKPHPRRPGRKSGDQHGPHEHRPEPEPADVDQTIDVPIGPCPHCGGDVAEADVAVQYQQEIPRKPIVRKFVIHRGQCKRCGRNCRDRDPLQTSDAAGAAACQLGPDAQAAVVYFNKHAGLSYGKISDLYQQLFGIKLTRGAAAQIVLRAGRKLEPAVSEIDDHIQQAQHITPDESGWRIGGFSVWIHAWVAEDGATRYRIDPRRNADKLEETIGIGWSGSMTHDGLSTYERFASAVHQQCLDHALRRARTLVESQPEADRVFPQQVIEVCVQALRLRDRWEAKEAVGEPPSTKQREAAYWRYSERLDALTGSLLMQKERTNTLDAKSSQANDANANNANAKFAGHLSRHAGDWFTFLLDPSIPATNCAAEQALKTPIVNRKVWGGNRTANGASAQEATSSVVQTCKKRAINALAYLSAAFRGIVTSLFS